MDKAQMKVFIGPLNIASQPYYLAEGLRKFGIDAHCITYETGTFGYQTHKSYAWPKAPAERVEVFNRALMEAYEENFDIYHFFQRPFYFPIPSGDHDSFIGSEIPLLKSRGKRVAYRFTGWELVNRELEMQKNPYSAFHHGWDGRFNPELKAEYLEFLRAQVDAFMVVDPMMHEHCPEADIVPRILPVSDFEEVGIEKKAVPLIVHAPSNNVYKGSKFILKAFEDLRNEGLKFDVQLLNRVLYTEALDWYRRADIIVDQVLIGWYGVLATECMAMGKPVAVYVRDDLAKTPEDIPIHNINLDTIKDQLRNLIQDFDLRNDLATRGRGYVKAVHDESVVIPKLINVYKKMMAQPNTGEGKYGDFEFLKLQRLKYEEMTQTINRQENAIIRDKSRRADSIREARKLQEKVDILTNKVKSIGNQSQNYKKMFINRTEQRNLDAGAAKQANSDTAFLTSEVERLTGSLASVTANGQAERKAKQAKQVRINALEATVTEARAATNAANAKVQDLKNRVVELTLTHEDVAAVDVDSLPIQGPKIAELREREGALKQKLYDARTALTEAQLATTERVQAATEKANQRAQTLQDKVLELREREAALKARLQRAEAN